MPSKDFAAFLSGYMDDPERPQEEMALRSISIMDEFIHPAFVFRMSRARGRWKDY